MSPCRNEEKMPPMAQNKGHNFCCSVCKMRVGFLFYYCNNLLYNFIFIEVEMEYTVQCDTVVTGRSRRRRTRFVPFACDTRNLLDFEVYLAMS